MLGETLFQAFRGYCQPFGKYVSDRGHWQPSDISLDGLFNFSKQHIYVKGYQYPRLGEKYEKR
jgi:hypothetical protein